MTPLKRPINPLDELFDTLPQSMEEDDDFVEVTEGQLATMQSSTQVQAVEKDEEDIEIDHKIDTVYTAAIDAFNQQTAQMEVVEPRYVARIGEVAANYLNIALGAATARAKVKGDRKKNAQFVPFNNARNDGLVTASREDIMKMIAIDAETKKG